MVFADVIAAGTGAAGHVVSAEAAAAEKSAAHKTDRTKSVFMKILLRACYLTFARAALREKIVPDRGPRGLRPWGGDEAESDGCGGPTAEDDNEVWRDFRRNPGVPDTFVAGWKPKGWGQFSSFRCRSSLEGSRHSSVLTP